MAISGTIWLCVSGKPISKRLRWLKKGQAQLPLTFALTEGGHEQHGQISKERLVFKLWDRQTLGLKHIEKFSQDTQEAITNKYGAYSNEKNTYLLELVRTEQHSDRDASPILWFLELVEQNVLGNISQGSPETVQRRRAWLKARGYEGKETHGPFYSYTPGVLYFPGRTGYASFLSSFREKVDITLLSIEPLWVAATFGLVALSILTANGMRVGELVQIRASAESIVPITLSPPPDAEDQTPIIHWAVQAVPKGHHTQKTYYLDDEHLRLLSLIKLMLCQHYQINPQTGGEIPRVILRGETRHRFAPDPDSYLFQYNGLGLYEEDIRVCLRFLLHGLVFQTLEGRQVIVYPHLLRHGFATWALNVAKEPVGIVAAIPSRRRHTR